MSSDKSLSAKDWVKRSREQQKKREQQRIAERRAKLLEEQDEQAVDSSHLKGVRVAHSADKFEIGQVKILTLKDKGVLDGLELNEDVDELEEIHMKESENRELAVERSKIKPTYNAAEYMGAGKALPLLAQYDQEEREKNQRLANSFTLTETGSSMANTVQPTAESVRDKLAKASKLMYDLQEQEKSIASEYYTKEELMTFRKSRRKKSKKGQRKKRRRKALDEIGTSEAAGEGEEMKSEAAAEDVELSPLHFATDDEMNIEDEEEGLFISVPQAPVSSSSSNTTVNTRFNEEEVAASLAKKRQEKQRQEAEGEKRTGSGLVFTSTSEFCRNIQVQNRRQKEEELEMRVKEQREEVEEKEREQRKQQKKGAKNTFVSVDDEDGNNANGGAIPPDASGYLDPATLKDSDEEENEDEDDEGEDFAFGEQPLASGGLGDALRLMKEKGMKAHDMDIMGGRRSDQQKRDENGDITILRTDEFGRPMTRKEAFRKLSHKFHGKLPGKNKQEQRMRQYKEAQRIRAMSSTDTPLKTVEAFRATQKRTQNPFVLLQGGNVSRFEDSADVDNVKLEKKKPPKKKTRKRKQSQR